MFVKLVIDASLSLMHVVLVDRRTSVVVVCRHVCRWLLLPQRVHLTVRGTVSGRPILLYRPGNVHIVSSGVLRCEHDDDLLLGVPWGSVRQ